MAWMTRAAPACAKHGYGLLQKCVSCGAPIRWARPGVSVCRCGRFYKPVGEPEPLQPELQSWLNWTEAVIGADPLAADKAASSLPALVRSMSIDGAYRLIEAFGLLETASDPVREVRHVSASLRTVGNVLARGLRRLGETASSDDINRLPFELAHLPALRDLADRPACEADGLRAAWLLDIYRAARPSGSRRVGARPKRQLPLFL